MARQLLLVAPAKPGRTDLKRFLGASGYEVVERSYESEDPATGDFRPDLVLVDHETDINARLALRSHLGVDDGQCPVPVVEMCLGRPDMYQDALEVLDRVSGARPRFVR
jgi:hypothetical protein